MRKSSEVLSQIYSDKNKNAKNNKRKKSSEVLAEKGIDFNTIKQQKDTSGLFQKSDGNFIQSVGGTVGDLASDIGEGFFSAMEGIADWGQYRVADAFDLFGADKPANAIRDNAKFNSTAAIFGKNEDVNDNLFGKGWTDTLEKNSVLGDTADVINQGIGQVGAMAATAAVGGAIIGGGAKAAGMVETAANINKVRTVASALTSYTSAYGNARSEAYRNGADDSTANKTAMISGFSEAIAEQFFEGLPGIKVEGWADKVTGKMAGGLEKAFGTKIGKTFMKVSDVLGEGAEEMISNALQATGNNIVHFFDRNYTYGMENQSGNVFKDFVDAFTSEDSVKSFFSAAMTSALIGGGNTFLTTAQKNTIINEYAKENNMSAKEAKTMLENTVMAETQAIAGKENFSDKMDVMDNIQKQELQNMKRNVFVEQGQRDKPFEYKETDNEQVNNMLKSLSEKGNNTTENHITAQIAEKLIRDLGYDVEYTNNDELVNSGREANAAGWKEGNKLVLNLDSNELDSFILGHESGHFFENQGDLYKTVSDTLFELAESKGIHKQELERHKKLYANYINNKIAKEETNLGRKLTEEEKTAIEEDVIKRELTADYIGSFFTDRDFFESLGKKNPTILQKFYDFIEDLINKLPGRQYQAKLKEAKNLIREVYNSYSEGGVINDSNSIDADIVKNEAISEQKQEEGINIPTAQETKLEQSETISESINLPTAEKIETKENNNLDEYLKIKNEYDNTNDSNRKAELETKLMELEDTLTQKELKQISKSVKLESKSENVKNVEKNVDNVENLPTKTKIDNQKGIENIKNKYDAAEKIDGAKKTIVLANGEKLTGTYKLLEAGNVAASHNAETFAKTEGFPTTEKGTTVNDRDYQSDRQAQQLVTQKSLNYDGRAFADNGVIVTKDGIVVSGNDRTMSGDLAAKSNKDSKYIEYLKDNAEQFGFTTEQIESMNHPRVVLELNETLDYDTKTFAKFNKDSKKSKSVAEKAKEIGKTIDNNTIESISDIIDKFETIDELYNNDKATRDLLSILQTKGILDSNEISEVYNGSKFTGTGKDLVESVVLGSVISEENAKYFSNNNDLKFKVMKVAPAIIQNKTLNEYSINDILNYAIEVYKKASSSDMTIDEFTGQYNIFGDNDVDLVTKRIAQLLETRGYKNLRNFLDKYNAMAELPATGQIDIFSSNGVETREDVLNKALNIDDNTEIQYLLSGINSNMSLTKEKKLIVAQKLKEKHLKNKFIWALTGWNLDNADGNWKYEISDPKFKIKPKVMEGYTLGELVSGEQLFKAYPQLRDNVEVLVFDTNEVNANDKLKGRHTYKDGIDYIGINAKLSDKEKLSTLSHEIQHIIQRIEGFATGTNTEFYVEGGKFLGKDVDKDFGYELYRRTAGEVESRNVQGRMNLNPIEKRLKSFNETRDVKDKDIITRESMQEAIDRKKSKMAADTQYMLSEDNKGRKLSEGQREKFKDSKVKDDEGRLITVYHGSPSEFNIFDIEKAGKNGVVFGNGFYFTDDKDSADGYANGNGKTLEGYLDIKKPASSEDLTIELSDLKKLYDKLQSREDLYDEDMEMSYIDALLSDYDDDKNTALRTFYFMNNESDVKLIDALSYIENPTEMYKELRNTLGYDGIIVEKPIYGDDQTYYIAFNSDQFKNVDNTNPTNSDDIRYLLSDKDRLPLYESKNKLGNELTGRTVEVPGENLPVAERPNLQPKKDDKQYQTALPGFKEMEVGTPTRHEIITKFRDLAKNELGDITKIKDKKKGILYQINTMKRNLRDIMSPEQAKTMYDTYFKPITENNAAIENDITSYNERIQKYNLTNEESVYTQLVGELKYNPESELTSKKVEEYFNKNSKKIDKEKVNKAVEEFRNIYDELIGRINDTLVENGYKPIEYRKGYFPHFIEEKATSPIGKLAEKLGWRIKSGTLPTDIAGITDQFKPGKAWTSFSQQRTSDATDYNALKGLDNYIRGAMDVIHHTEDIQKLRALENEIRYQYSDKGIQQKIDDIYLDDDLDAEEKDNAIYKLTKDFRNSSLGNFATEIRNYTDNLANKKSFGDRSMEQSFGRDTYSIMQNINSRVSANMVGANISSAMTNFIPITQAWSQVSTKNLMKGVYESIKTSIKDDGFANNSVYLTNRTKQADRLFKTGLDKINDKLGIPFEAIDSFTSNTIVRAKYYDNLEKGMSEKEAMSNADEFAKDVMAGRSKGDMPTIFNQKNPITKLFTAFQLEVNNQYGYMFKDIRADLGGEAKDKIAAAFIKMFLGAYLYNMLSEKITGRKSAFSPIDMAIDDIKTATNDNMDIGDKISSIATDTAKELPFVGGLMGGGRLPLQGAIPYNNPLEMVTETISDTSKVFDGDESKKKTAINNLVKEWSKPLYYVAMPFAGGQIKKTVEGLSMYDENLPVAGSYTNSGKLRFEADDSTLGKLQAAVFGQYASKNAREYFENGYSPLTEKQVNTALESGLSIDEYREYNSGINAAKKIAKENNNSQTEAVYDYITNLPLADNQKNTLLNSALGNSDTVKDKNGYIKYVDNKNRAYWYDEENNTLYNKNYYEVSTDKLNELTKYSNKKDISNYSEYNSLEEFNYATKNPEKYAAITQISDFNSYNSYKDEIDAISEKYSDLMDNATNSKQKSAISNRKKQEIFGYINSLNLNKYQKTMLYKLAGGYSIKNYKNDMFNYINSLELTAEEKQTIYNELFD